VPEWMQLVTALFGGGVLKALVDLWRDRERHVWTELRRVNDENKDLRHQRDGLLRGNWGLKLEVNDLRVRLGDPAKYDVRRAIEP
jgi:regulator of replication initiation timing